VIPRTRTAVEPGDLGVEAVANQLPNDANAATAAGSACDLRLVKPTIAWVHTARRAGRGRHPAADTTAIGVSSTELRLPMRLGVTTRTSRLDEIELNDLDVEVVEGQEVEVPSAVRVWLLEQLESIDRAQSICDALMAVEATQSVALGNLDRAWLLGYLEGVEARGRLPAELRPFVTACGSAPGDTDRLASPVLRS